MIEDYDDREIGRDDGYFSETLLDSGRFFGVDGKESGLGSFLPDLGGLGDKSRGEEKLDVHGTARL